MYRPIGILVLSALLLAACAAPPESGVIEDFIGAPEERPERAINPPRPEDFGSDRLLTIAWSEAGSARTSPGMPVIERYLERVLGVEVVLAPVADYESLVTIFDRADVDLALFPPLTYVKLAERTPTVKPLVRAIARGSTTYPVYVLVRDDDPARALLDLASRRFTFVDPNSASGFLYAYEAFRKAGLDPARSLELTPMSGDHVHAMEMLLAGETDAIATWTTDRPPGERSGRDVRILAKIGRLPHDVLCGRPDLAKPAQEAVRGAMMNLTTMGPEGRQIFTLTDSVTGWIPSSNEDFSAIASEWSVVRAALETSPLPDARTTESRR